MDSIFAISSGAPPAAIGIVRISGDRAGAALSALAGDLPEPRRASLRRIYCPKSGEILDHALILWFPGPGTATGEDLAEIHAHGGSAVLAAIENALDGVAGLRRAEPGEFTRRALMHGRIDLTEAEGLGDLLAAETESARRASLRLAEGGLRTRVEDWQARILQAAAGVEALLDHVDEGDVDEGSVLSSVTATIAGVSTEMKHLLAGPPVERLRDGIRVILAGPPNSGKSSLLNALAQREAAIVSDIAGTTRDRIEVPVQRGGIAYLLVDVAGLTESTDPIETIGVARARDAMMGADILLWMGDAAPPEVPGAVIAVHPRMDMPDRAQVPADRVGVSSTTGDGVEALWQYIGAAAQALVPSGDQLALNRRQRTLLGQAAAALDGVGAAGASADMLLLAEELRSALGIFDQITGRAGVEAMLDALFGSFCIGK